MLWGWGGWGPFFRGGAARRGAQPPATIAVAARRALPAAPPGGRLVSIEGSSIPTELTQGPSPSSVARQTVVFARAGVSSRYFRSEYAPS
jgi:hypothetical protein